MSFTTRIDCFLVCPGFWGRFRSILITFTARELGEFQCSRVEFAVYKIFFYSGTLKYPLRNLLSRWLYVFLEQFLKVFPVFVEAPFPTRQLFLPSQFLSPMH